MYDQKSTDEIQEEAWGAAPRVISASRWERILWYAAGANGKLLVRCPNSDRVKYQGLGGVVWATTLLAAVSGGYAYYTVFSPKVDTALDKSVDYPSVVYAAIVGLVWSMIIFNLDRFIVSSAGKGDGTDKITWGEFGRAIPRIIMATLIGLCISAPLEIRILKPEIDQQLSLEQGDHEIKLTAKKQALYDQTKAQDGARIKQLEAELAADRLQQEKLRLEIEAKRIKFEDETSGESGSGKAGMGAAARALAASLEEKKSEKAVFDATLATKEKATGEEIAQLRKHTEDALHALDVDKLKNAKQAKSLDGLLRRIQISHEIGGLVPYLIMGMLLAIELAPLFFKMMLTKGVYDYLEENEKQLRIAYLGVVVEHVLVPASKPDEKSETEIRERFLRAERVAAEETARLESEKHLTNRLHMKLRVTRGAEIERDPGKFLIEPDSKA